MVFLTAVLVVFAISMVSAATFTVSKTSLEFSQPDVQDTFTLTPAGLSSYTITLPTNIKQENDQPIVLSYTGTVDNISLIETITITATSINYDELDIGKTYRGDDIIIKNNANPADFVTIPVSFQRSLCKAGETGSDLSISDINIDNNGAGDDNEWFLLDEIEVEVEVTNENNDDRINDIFVEMFVFDSEGNNVASDLVFSSSGDEEFDLGNIKKDDKESIFFKFKVPADFNDGDYDLVFKTYSDDNEYGEEVLCVISNEESISVERESDEEKHIIVDDIKVSPTIAKCGEMVQVSADVVNIGDEDYEDQVRVTLSIPELKINLEQSIRKDFDQGDSKVVDFDFTIPLETEEKLYTLEFRTYYDYDKDDDTYNIVSDDAFISQLRVEGNCQVEAKSAKITAELDSETPTAMPGKQVIINANLENTGDVETVYTLSVSGNSAWSNLVSIDPQLVTLAPGDSKEINIVLAIDEDASGDNEFTIRASYDDLKTEQKVVLSISGESSAEMGPFVQHLKENWFIYLIIIVNIILIIAIILVIRSMVAPRPM